MTVAKGMKVNLFASEKEFPELAKPVQMAFDAKGRLWVAVWPTYPHWKPKEEMNDKILILEDTDGDGKADKMTVFADDLHCPTGFEFCNGGVLVAQAPDLMFLKDTDGDDKADVRDARARAASTRPTRTTRPTASGSTRAGRSTSRKGRSTTRRSRRPTARRCGCANAGVFRYEPRTQKFEVYVTYGFANPHGHVFDRWGQDIVIDGTGAESVPRARCSRATSTIPHKHARPPQVYQQRTRPCPGIEILSSRHFPERMQGNLLVANVHRLPGHPPVQDRATTDVELRRHARSSRSSRRPTRTSARPTSRSGRTARSTSSTGRTRSSATCSTTSATRAATATHGRIYRVTYEGRPLLEAARRSPASRSRSCSTCSRSRRTASATGPRSSWRRATPTRSSPRSNKWVAGLDKSDADYEHHLTRSPLGPPVPQRRRTSTCSSGCSSRPTSAPGPRPRACSATGATACPTRSSCSRSWPPTRIRASGSRRSAPPASSRCPRRSRSP